jgi:hypothetical protein
MRRRDFRPITHCSVAGHSTRCIVAYEIRESESRQLTRKRRRVAKRAIARWLKDNLVSDLKP